MDTYSLEAFTSWCDSVIIDNEYAYASEASGHEGHLIQKILDWFKGIIDKITNWIMSIPSKLKEAKTKLTDGLKKIKKFFNKAKNAKNSEEAAEAQKDANIIYVALYKDYNDKWKVYSQDPKIFDKEGNLTGDSKKKYEEKNPNKNVDFVLFDDEDVNKLKKMSKDANIDLDSAKNVGNLKGKWRIRKKD